MINATYKNTKRGRLVKYKKVKVSLSHDECKLSEESSSDLEAHFTSSMLPKVLLFMTG